MVNADGTKTVKKSDGSIVKYSKTGKEVYIAASAASMPSPETPPKKKHLKKPTLTPPSPSGRGILMIHAAIRLNDVEQAKWLVDGKVRQCCAFDELSTT